MRITGKTDNLKPVPKSRGNSIKNICRRNKHDIGKIKRYFKIMVRELRVLLGVKRFKERRGRITAEVGADLIDLIKHKDRIFRTCVFYTLNNPPRQCADIRAPVSPDFGLITYASQ